MAEYVWHVWGRLWASAKKVRRFSLQNVWSCGAESTSLHCKADGHTAIPWTNDDPVQPTTSNLASRRRKVSLKELQLV